MARARTYSSSSDSSSVSTANSTMRLHDPSNILYDDRQHYQVIFKNDSRFFDTSLHLFKSYQTSGYIPPKYDKRKKGLFTSSNNQEKTRSKKFSDFLGRRPAGFSSNHNINQLTEKQLTQPFVRDYEYSMSQRSDSGIMKLRGPRSNNVNSTKSVPHPRPPLPSAPSNRTKDYSSDESDIIVTRL